MNLDLVVYNYLYTQCLKLGSAFGYGAMEGLYIYALCILAPILSIKKGK